MNWLAAQERTQIFVTSITQAEIFYGLEVLPAGRRRTRLHSMIEKLFSEEFRGRVLAFDEEPARLFGAIVAGREALGRPVSQFDAMIAAIARSRRAAVATRNVNDFDQCGVRIIDPWAS